MAVQLQPSLSLVDTSGMLLVDDQGPVDLFRRA